MYIIMQMETFRQVRPSRNTQCTNQVSQEQVYFEPVDF